MVEYDFFVPSMSNIPIRNSIHQMMFQIACARTINSAFCQILGKLSLFSVLYLLFLVVLEDHLVYCKCWKHTLRVPWTKTVSAIRHYYVLNVFKAIEWDTEKMIGEFVLSNFYLFWISWKKGLVNSSIVKVNLSLSY